VHIRRQYGGMGPAAWARRLVPGEAAAPGGMGREIDFRVPV